MERADVLVVLAAGGGGKSTCSAPTYWLCSPTYSAKARRRSRSACPSGVRCGGEGGEGTHRCERQARHHTRKCREVREETAPRTWR